MPNEDQLKQARSKHTRAKGGFIDQKGGFIDQILSAHCRSPFEEAENPPVSIDGVPIKHDPALGTDREPTSEHEHLRPKFEKWAAEPFNRMDINRFGDSHMYAGQYSDQETHAAWQAWKQSHYDTLRDAAKLAREVLIDEWTAKEDRS